MGWLSDDMEDVGGIMFDLEEAEKERDRLDDIKADRKKRMAELEGKFVVSTTGKSSQHQVFYQNRSLFKGGYWTRFLSNAIGFPTEERARQLARTFRYGNPRIAVVKDGCYKWIK